MTLHPAVQAMKAKAWQLNTCRAIAGVQKVKDVIQFFEVFWLDPAGVFPFIERPERSTPE